MPWEPAPGAELGGYRIAVFHRPRRDGDRLSREQMALGRKVALKILSSELAEDEEFRRRFVKECRLAAGLEHMNVVPVYDAGEAEGLLYLAMRFIDGTDLKRLLEREVALSLDRAISILA